MAHRVATLNGKFALSAEPLPEPLEMDVNVVTDTRIVVGETAMLQLFNSDQLLQLVADNEWILFRRLREILALAERGEQQRIMEHFHVLNTRIVRLEGELDDAYAERDRAVSLKSIIKAKYDLVMKDIKKTEGPMRERVLRTEAHDTVRQEHPELFSI